MYYSYYLKLLNYQKMPNFLKKYLNSPSLVRLKKVGYFCGMDYASRNVYDFKEKISRFDHSLSVALLIYKFTKNKKMTLAGLFHDVATPCFSHVIDYMNNDYATQESTEEFTEEILKSDKYVLKSLRKDKINIDDIVDFKKYTIVDNKRPKLCADRIDGVILTGSFWAKNIVMEDIKRIVKSLALFQNEDKELELGFNDKETALKVVKVSEEIDVICHSNEDNYMMQLLADMTKYAIDNNYFTYKDLFYYNEEEIFRIFESIDNKEFKNNLNKFKNIKLEDIPIIELPFIKKRDLNPLIMGKRAK